MAGDPHLHSRRILQRQELCHIGILDEGDGSHALSTFRMTELFEFLAERFPVRAILGLFGADLGIQSGTQCVEVSGESDRQQRPPCL